MGPALLIVFALWAAREERVGSLPALVFAALVGLAGAAVYAAYALADKRCPPRDGPIAAHP